MEKLVFFEQNELAPIFDTQDCQRISKYLQKQFASFLDNENFEINAGYKNNQIQIKLTLRKADDSFFYPIESVFIYDEAVDESDRPAHEDIALIMLDYLTMYFEEFLSEGRSVFLPINWSVHQSEDLTFFLRGFTRNLKLEQDADALLAKHGHGEHAIESISAET